MIKHRELRKVRVDHASPLCTMSALGMFPMVGMSRFWEFVELDSQQLSHRHSPGAMGAEASSVYRRPKPPSCSWLKYILHEPRKDGGN